MKTVNGHKIIKRDGWIQVVTSWGYAIPWGFYDLESAEEFCLQPEQEIRDHIRDELAYLSDAHNCYNNRAYTSDGPAGSGEYCEVCGALVKSYDE